MIVLNFSHPLNGAHQAQIESLAGRRVDEVREIPVKLDDAQPYAGQAAALAEAVGFNSREWQTTPFVVNPPSQNYAALALLAELHGRMGYFPAVLRLRRAPAATPPEYEVVEIVNLQALRDAARLRRG